MIRRYAMTDASIHDSRVFDEVLDEKNSGHSIWADSACCSKEREAEL